MTPEEKEQQSANDLVTHIVKRVSDSVFIAKSNAGTYAYQNNQNPDDHSAARTAIIQSAIEKAECGIVRAILKEALK